MWRQSGPRFLALAALFLAACAGGGPRQGDIGFVEGFFGGIVTDEPRAALIGREVLSAGGTAADAVVAAYFTMAVTMPGSASLGGGGVCLVHDTDRIQTEAITFLPGRAAGDARFAVPGNVRGMFLLHARYGQLNWSDLLLPAEEFARAGHPVSRAFVRDYEASRSRVERDPAARTIYGDGAVAEGRLLRQLELGAVISNIRTLGPGTFYDGTLGRSFVESVARAGGGITLGDLRNYRPQLLPPLEFTSGNSALFFPPTAGGAVSAQVWGAAVAGDLYEDAAGDVRSHLLLELGARAHARTLDGSDAVSLTRGDAIAALAAEVSETSHRTVDSAPPVTIDAAHDGASIVAVDNTGRTVACSFTMNGPFGEGVVAPGTGILLAAAPDAPRASLPSAAIYANKNTGAMFLAVAGSGVSPALVARAALDTLVVSEKDVVTAVSEPRLFSVGNPDEANVEGTMSEPARDALRGLGHTLNIVGEIGRINGIHCPGGLPREQTCQVAKDPRSQGLAVNSEE